MEQEQQGEEEHEDCDEAWAFAKAIWNDDEGNT